MKMQACASRAAVTLAIVAILGGCGKGAIPTALPGGPAAGAPAAASPAARKGGKQKVEMRIKISRAPKHARGKALRPYFVASTTLGVKIVVYAHGSHTTPLATTIAGLTSANCHPVTGGRSCTIQAASPVGNDDFVVTTYDAAPSGGSFGSGKQLAFGSATLDVLQNKSNTIGLTLGGVVATAGVTLTNAGMPVIDTASQSITISAKDADGNTIVGGWFDATGNAVTMNLSSNAPSVEFSPAPNVATFASPTSKLTYVSSEATSAQVHGGFVANIIATPSNAGATAGQAGLALTVPQFTEFPIVTMGSTPIGIEVGPDNAIWFAEKFGNKIGRIATEATDGTHPDEYGGLPASSGPVELANDNDGTIWFTESCIGKVGSINPTTHAVGTSYITPEGTGSNPYGIAQGPDHDMWITENSMSGKVVKFDPASPATMTGYSPHSSSSYPQHIISYSGALWFTETSGSVNAIGKMTTSGTAGDYAVTPTNSIYQGGITAGPDGAMWFAECNNSGNSVGRIPASGSAITQYSLPTSPANPFGIVTGPDNAVWFAEQGADKIGRIDPTTHTIVEFALPTPPMGFTVYSPTDIILGPDGALWFTECDGDAIGRLQ
jgi:virginiamycin B lyase